MHLLHLCLKLCVVHPNRCFECDIYDDVQLKLYRKYIVTVHNTPAFTSKPHPKLKYNVDSAVLRCVYG